MDARIDQTDYEFTPKFYAYHNVQRVVACPFPLPRLRNLLSFFESREGKRFIAGSKQVLAAIRDWCVQQEIAVESLDVFTRRYFDLSFEEGDDLRARRPLYNEGVPILLQIEDLLRHPDITKKKSVIVKMLDGIDVCASGTYTNICIARDELLTEISLAYSFMGIRKMIIEQFVLEVLRKSQARDNIGMEIHYVNTILYMHRDLLCIEVERDALSNLCNERVLEDLSRKLLLNLSWLLSLDNIVNAILQSSDYEILVDQIKQKGYSAVNDFIEKLDSFGKEVSQPFLQMNDVVTSDDDYQTYQLAWSASHVIRASLLYRLVDAGFIKVYPRRQDIGGVQFHYFESESLRLAYVVNQQDAEGKIYQPMLVYLVKQLSVDSGLLDKLGSSDSFLGIDQYQEIANCCIDYYQSLNAEEQSKVYHHLARLINDKLRLPDVLFLGRGALLERYLASLSFAHIAQSLRQAFQLDLLLSVMNKATAASCLRYLYERKHELVQGAEILVVAAKNGLDEIVEDVLKDTPRKYSRHASNIHALQYACERGHLAVVQQLLAYSVLSIDADVGGGVRPLHIAINHFHPEIVALLLKYGANVNLCNFHGESPLYLAVQRGSSHLVNALLQAGAVVGFAPNKKPLVAFAIKNELFDVAVLLIRASEPANLKGIRLICDDFLHQLVLKNDLQTIAKVVRSFDVHELSFFNADSETPLYLAVAHQRYDIAQLLLARGCDPNNEDSYQEKYPLVAAVHNKDIRMLMLLLRYRARHDVSVNGESISAMILKADVPGMQRVLAIQNNFMEFSGMDEIHHDAYDRFRQVVFASDDNFVLHNSFFKALRYISKFKETANGHFNLSDLRNSVLLALHHYIKFGDVRGDQIVLLRFKCRNYIHALQCVSLSRMVFNFFYPDAGTPPLQFAAESAIEMLDDCVSILNARNAAVEAVSKKRRVGDV